MTMLDTSNLEKKKEKQATSEILKVIKTLTDGFWITDIISGKFIEVNDSYCTMIGYSREELLKMTINDVEVNETTYETEKHIKKIIENGHDRFETRHKAKSGKILDLEVSVTYSSIEKGRFYVFIRDITERKNTQEELRNIEWLLIPKDFSEETYVPIYGDITKYNTNRTIYDALGAKTLEDIVSDFMRMLGTSSAIYEKNGDYAIGIFSSGWCHSLDQASYSLCNTNDIKTALNCGKWQCHESCWTEASKTAIESGTPTDIECAGGIHLYAVPIRIGNEIIGAINFGYGNPPNNPEKIDEIASKYNIDKEKLIRLAKEYKTRPQFIIDYAKTRLESAANLIALMVERNNNKLKLQQTLTNLEISNKDLEQFAYVASHDLQEPLRMISSYTQMLEKKYRDKLDSDALEFIHYAVDGASRMQKLINDLLDYSRITIRGKNFEQVDFSSVLGITISNLQQLIIDNTAIITNDELPMLKADESQIVRVFQNLIANAIKFKKKSVIPQIHISCKQKKNLYEFSIRDNGIGMDMKYHDRVFTIFQRLHSIKDYPGTGIGLSVCKRIIERHGGTIWFESKENEGTTFYFTISTLS